MPAFKIPRQSDETLLRAIAQVRGDLSGFKLPFQIRVMPFEPGGQPLDLPDQHPENAPPLAPILAEKSEIIPWLELRCNNFQLLKITRQLAQVADEAIVANDANAVNTLPADTRSNIVARLISSSRRHLKAADIAADLSGGTDSAWTRYRDSQQLILRSLEETQQTIMRDFARKMGEWEVESKSRLDKHRDELDAEYKQKHAELDKDHSDKLEALAERETALVEREKQFNTKEARYVARSEQKNQVDQIRDWLREWSLTPGTRSKRKVVYAAYFVGAGVSLGLAIWLNVQTMALLESAEKNVAAITWWQWALLSLKSLLPLAFFITLVIYFIRWTSEWARQHADEEFRNRTRVLDIGRSAWLLEAVRDAQDNKTEIPPDLLKDLSRNLFSLSPVVDPSDLHPQAISDLIMQGLASLRLKTPDGTEIEAKRTGRA